MADGELTLSGPGPSLTLSSESDVLTLSTPIDQLTLSSSPECSITFSGSNNELSLGVDVEVLSLSSTVPVLTFGAPVPIGVGEANTASNLAAVGPFSTKVGVDLRFKGLQSLAAALTVADGGSTVDLDFNEGFDASCQAGDSVGDTVYITALGVTGTPDVSKAGISSVSTLPMVGLITSKPTPTTCFVQTSGIVGGFVGLTVGAAMFASPSDGALTQTRPTTAGQYVQRVGIATSTTEIYLNPRPPTGLS